MSRTIIRIDMPNGLIYFHSAENHLAAHASVDPFLWVLQREPEVAIPADAPITQHSTDK